jgi:hypothetical protein
MPSWTVSGMERVGSGIRDKHPGSGTLAASKKHTEPDVWLGATVRADGDPGEVHAGRAPDCSQGGQPSHRSH